MSEIEIISGTIQLNLEISRLNARQLRLFGRKIFVTSGSADIILASS